MWVSDYLKKMVEIYHQSEHIGEILIIDNNPSKKFDLFSSDKVKIITKGYNIFVNPAWNFGVANCSCENIILANDDILIDLNDLNKLMVKINEYIVDDIVIGPHELSFKTSFNPNVEIVLDSTIRSFTYGWGTFMVMTKKSYVDIPENVIIWYGDNIQHDNNTPYRFSGIEIKTPMSTTIFSNNNLYTLACNDHTEIQKINKNSLVKKYK